MKEVVWFSEEVAKETHSINAAIVLNELQQCCNDNAKPIGLKYTEIDYKHMFKHFPNDYMNQAQSLRMTIKILCEHGYGYFVNGQRGRRPRFVFMKEYIIPNDFIEGQFLATKGIKTGYVHNLLCQKYSGVEINKHESKLAYEITESCNDLVSFEGVRKAMRKLQKDGYISFIEKDRSKNKPPFKKGYGIKIIKSVKEICSEI